MAYIGFSSEFSLSDKTIQSILYKYFFYSEIFPIFNRLKLKNFDLSLENKEEYLN